MNAKRTCCAILALSLLSATVAVAGPGDPLEDIDIKGVAPTPVDLDVEGPGDPLTDEPLTKIEPGPGDPLTDEPLKPGPGDPLIDEEQAKLPTDDAEEIRKNISVIADFQCLTIDPIAVLACLLK